VVVEIIAITVLQYGTEALTIDLNGIVELYDVRVLEFLMDVILPQGMLDVVALTLLSPTVVEVVDLTCSESDLI
jgi:hypothetical protein